MDKKLRQVTDNIHGTIFLSGMESEMIATPYFYRLHDIYQSSTVYMTFPTNRTKRYEHSLGTMELASTMLFSAVSNASIGTREKLFNNLRSFMEEILNLVIINFEEQVAPYLTINREQIAKIFEGRGMRNRIDASYKEVITNDIKDALIKGCFMDSALDHFQYYPMQVDEKSNYTDIQNVFLYRCMLQAVRIIALFHDVGHPPYSHIMEDVLNELYSESTKKENVDLWNDSKLEIFLNCMERYESRDKDKAYSCQTLYSKSSLLEAQLHERVGLSFLQSAINDVVPSIISSIVNSGLTKSHKKASVLYYIMIVELAIAMLVEKNMFFKSLHKIVDGIIDADRLDYIMRDSLNSGIDWGKIPYKRLINSAKLIHASECEDKEIAEDKEQIFFVAYPQKVTDDIEDLLLVRYKIYARINFHHRCMKTTATLKAAIKELALDYLTNKEDSKCINPDISMLWTSLGMNVGDRQGRVILWNDSWLISTLHNALVKLKYEYEGKNTKLKDNLEEILLNKKRYYTLLKRGSDSRELVNKIFEYSGISVDELIKLKTNALKKYYVNYDDNVSDNELLKKNKPNATDTIRRIECLLDILNMGDLERLFSYLAKDEEKVVSEALEELVKETYLQDFKVIKNEGRCKTGLPMHKDDFDSIYIYAGNKCFLYNPKTILQKQIRVIEQNIPWIFIYVAPVNGNGDINKLENIVICKVAEKIGKYLQEKIAELYVDN